MPDDKAKWLAELKVGDWVVVHSYLRRNKRTERIARFTERFIVTDSGRRFRRKDGYKPGGGSIVYFRWLDQPTKAQAHKTKAGKAGR